MARARMLLERRRRRASTSAGRARPTRPPSSTGRSSGPASSRSSRRSRRSASALSIDSWRPRGRAPGPGGRCDDASTPPTACRTTRCGASPPSSTSRSWCRSSPGRTRGSWPTSSSGTRSTRLIEFFTDRLAVADRYGLRHRCIIDPGTGFAPPGADWEERYRVPEARVRQPRPAAPVRPPAVRRPAVEGVPAARRGARAGRVAGPRLRPQPPPVAGPRASKPRWRRGDRSDDAQGRPATLSSSEPDGSGYASRGPRG